MQTLNNYLYFLEDFYFRGLTALEDLKFVIDNIDPIDIFLENQTNLINLDLSNNGLEFLPEQTLRNKNKLRTLSLANNNFEQLPSNIFDSLTNLESLDLSYNQLTTLQLAHDNIRTLNLSNNTLLHITEKMFLPKLTNINIWDCTSISGVDILKGTTNLKEICNSSSIVDKYCEKKDKTLEHVEELILRVYYEYDPTPLLKYYKDTYYLNSIDIHILNYSKSKPFQTNMMKIFENNKNLRRIVLYGWWMTSTISFDNLEFLENLIIIDSSNFNLNNPNLLKFGAMNMNPGSLQLLFSKCTKLLEITFSFCVLEPLEENAFDNQHSLEELDLSGNEIIKLPDKVFKNLHNLKTLNLAFNQIHELPKSIFDNLTSLTELALGMNNLYSFDM